jgi:SAM-dependent methyltransferase
MGGLVDWELLHRLITPPAFAQSPMWDAFADRYNGYVALQSEYTRLQIDMFAIAADDTVLDVGAGPGRIAIPAAAKARSVTALDISRPMLDHLQRNAQAAACENIHVSNLSWADVRPGDNVDMHDIVVASRSPAMNDLKKLDALARKRVYVLFFAGPSLKSFHDSLVAGIEPEPPAAGARPSPMPAYALIFNRLAAMGLEVNVRFIRDGFSHTFRDWPDLLQQFSWLGISSDAETRFRDNIAPYLTESDKGIALRMETRTVVLWWDKAQAPVQTGMTP